MNSRTAITLILAASALTACGNAARPAGDMRGVGPRSRSAATRTAAGTSASLSIEQASRKLDLGKNVTSAAPMLEAHRHRPVHELR